ncbi:MAG TPA: DUF4142 domain-containing protein [Xanthomonadaceae bacterium]|jgi:putative membrane protein
MKRFLYIALALTLAGISSAQYPPAPRAPDTAVAQPSGSNADIGFYQQALAGGVREILLSRQAMSQSASAGVRTLASTMVEDHTTLDRELAEAGKLSEPPPSAADRKEVADLQRMSGALFDSTYLAAMERDHERAITLFNETMLHAHELSTRDLATKALDTLHHHLTDIEIQQHRSAGD